MYQPRRHLLQKYTKLYAFYTGKGNFLREKFEPIGGGRQQHPLNPPPLVSLVLTKLWPPVKQWHIQPCSECRRVHAKQANSGARRTTEPLCCCEL